MVTWHPDIATQLVLSSEDDHSPVIQLWDLRFAASPLKVSAHMCVIIHTHEPVCCMCV